MGGVKSLLFSPALPLALLPSAPTWEAEQSQTPLWSKPQTLWNQPLEQASQAPQAGESEGLCALVGFGVRPIRVLISELTLTYSLGEN